MKARLILSLLAVLLPLEIARSDEAAEKLVLATYKLAGSHSTATGMVVQEKTADGKPRRFVVTAHHVLDQMRGNSCKLVSRTRKKDGTFQRKEISISIRKDGKNLWKKHAKHDLAVLPLPDSVDVEALPFDCLPTEKMLAGVRTGDAVRLAVFPELSEANNAGFPILRGGSIASYPIVPIGSHPIFLVDTTAWEGDSGGPVIHESLRSPSGGPAVIGLVLGMRNIIDTDRESRYVERRTRYPLGISEVLHAAFVRELILKELAK